MHSRCRLLLLACNAACFCCWQRLTPRLKGYKGLLGSACCGEGESCLSGTSAVLLAYCFDNTSDTLVVFKWPESDLLTCSAPATSSTSSHYAKLQ